MARPYAYVTLDALVVKCREGGRTVNVCVVHAVGVNRDGFRESLGLDVVTAEDGAAWLAFLRSLVARGLGGVKLVSSDAHPGLVDAIAATLPGASWQRCRTHFMRNLLTRVPKSAQSFVATMVRTIFAQPDAETVHEQHARIVDQLEQRFPEAAALLDEAGPDLLAFTAQPKEHWRQLWSTDENVKRCGGASGAADFGRVDWSRREPGEAEIGSCGVGLPSDRLFSGARGLRRPAPGMAAARLGAFSGRYDCVVGAGDPGPKSGASGMEAPPRRIAA